MSARSRTKGAKGEREAAERLRELYPAADRAPMQSRGAKRDGCEVVGTPWHVEVKYTARPADASPRAAMAQALRDTKGNPPLVMTRIVNRSVRNEPWLVSMQWDDFAEVIAELHALRSQLRAAQEIAKTVARAEPVRLRALTPPPEGACRHHIQTADGTCNGHGTVWE